MPLDTRSADYQASMRDKGLKANDLQGKNDHVISKFMFAVRGKLSDRASDRCCGKLRIVDIMSVALMS